jgi:Mn-containing catalase
MSKSISDLLHIELTDICSAERLILAALPGIRARVSSDLLSQTLQIHQGQTEAQLRRLQMIFCELDLEPDHDHCSKVAQQLLVQADESFLDMPIGPALDSAIIAGLQRLEHYQMAAYATAGIFSRIVGKTRIAQLLAKTHADKLNSELHLSQIAESLFAQVPR